MARFVMMRRLRHVLIGLVAVFALMAGALTLYGLQEDVTISDAAIVLGCRVEPDGAPSAGLAARLDRAVALYHDKRFAHVIVSGGREPENGFVEGEVMRDYLIAHQVPAAAITVEGRSRNTRENAEFSMAIMRAQGWRTGMVITEFFHLYRARGDFEQAGLAQPRYASAVSRLEFHSVKRGFREIAAIVVHSFD